MLQRTGVGVNLGPARLETRRAGSGFDIATRRKDTRMTNSLQKSFLCVLALLAGVACLGSQMAQAAGSGHYVVESARDIPIAYDVDVLVVGGTSGGVAAAVAAAEEGASVFLAAERPYLGVDICGTYRLWLESGEEPETELAKKVFTADELPPSMPKGVGFTYEASIASASMHKDSAKPSLLADGKWHSASSQSVQYDGDVTITADLGRNRGLKAVHMMVYQRRSPSDGSDFEVASVAISTSGDKQSWKKVAVVQNRRAGQSVPSPWGPVQLSADVTGDARYVRFEVSKAADVSRVLLGEIIIEDQEQVGYAEAADEAIVAVRPMHVKRTLDEALLEAKVQFLYGCYATDVLVDKDGGVAGIVMANRSGRQAVRAKVVIDATMRANVARMAGAHFRPYPSGRQTFERIVVGGKLKSGRGVEGKELPVVFPVQVGTPVKAIAYSLEIPMRDGSFASFARAEQLARDVTWDNGAVDASEVLLQVPPDAMKSKSRSSGDWPGAKKADLNTMRPAGISRMYVVGGCADVSRGAAEWLMRPVELMAVGQRVGVAAAREAKQARVASGVRVRGGEDVTSASGGEVKEDLDGIRSTDKGHVRSHERAIPVLGEYEVVVVGGGTGGAPAGISSGRKGAKTLVVEYLYGLGGVGTTGYISKYYYGYIEGFTKEIDAGVTAIGNTGTQGKPGGWNIEWKKEWYRRQMRRVGVDLWYGAIGCGAYVEDDQVKGVVVVTPHGRGVVLAGAVVDSTGNSDIAAAAGAECEYTGGDSVAVQGTGLPGIKMGPGYTNTDWTFVDDSDVVDVWRAHVTAKEKFKASYDLGQLVDTRERRRILGELRVSPMDIVMGRTFPDTVVIARSNFDSHGFAVHPLFMIRPPDREVMIVNVPYRCMLPKGLKGILVTGLGVSAHRDAMPVIRMQPDIQNQGYAVGIAAAMAAEDGKDVRDIDLKALQRHLVSKGNLPEMVLTDKDSLPIPADKVADAVGRLENDYDGLEIVLAHLDESLAMMRDSHEKASTKEARLVYAHVLGMLGDKTGAETLADAVEAGRWDKGWNFKGMGQFGMSVSHLDSLVVALGRTGEEGALRPIIDRVRELDQESELSHCRAVAVALETLGDKQAAGPLAELLGKPGMMGHAFTDISKAVDETPAGTTDNSTRNKSLKELFLARALYRCGDHDGLGEKILKQYASDLRAHYARHAREILAGEY